MAALRLAVNNTSSIPHPRPYQTIYYGSAHAKSHEWSRKGRAASKVGAIRAATIHLVLGRYYKALIHGENGEVLYTLTRKGSEIKIAGMFMLSEV